MEVQDPSRLDQVPDSALSRPASFADDCLAKEELGFSTANVAWTDALVRARGDRLEGIPFRSAMLRPGISLNDLPQQQRWDSYHLLNLADMMNWRSDWA